MDTVWITPGNKCREAIKMLLNIEGLSFDDAWPVIQKLMTLEHKALRNRYNELRTPVIETQTDGPGKASQSSIVSYR